MTVTPKPARAKAREAVGIDMDITDNTEREPVRETRALRPGEFLGRNGEILGLKRDPDRDLFDVPAHLKDPDWTYEWKRETVLGKPDDTHLVHLAENGWRPVMVEPGSKWASIYMAANYKGPIRREGNILMERPKAMTDMVLAQERQRAGLQMRDNADKYTRRRGAIDSNAAFTTNNPNVQANITESYEMGPAPSKPQMAID